MRTAIRVFILLATLLLVSGTKPLRAQDAGSPDQLFRSGYAAFKQNDFSTAVKNYSLAINLDPYRNYFYYNRGLAYRALGNTAQALQDFQTSNTYKQTGEAYYQIGLIKYEQNDTEGARQEFESAKLFRDNVERLNFFLGLIYFKANRFEEAEKCFSDYVATVKNQADAYYYLGLCQAKLARYEQSISNLKFAMMYRANDWKLFYKMYEIYLSLNDKPNALNSISMVIELGMRKAEYYEERARLFKDVGNDFRSDEDIKTAKELRSGAGKEE